MCCARAVRNGIFRTDLSLLAFGRLFYLQNVEVRANKTARWVRFLRAARQGRLLDRPGVGAGWKPHKVYHDPMYGVLQSSYNDVEFEMRVMCGREPPPPMPAGPYAKEIIMFVAGDGLALMRLNHLLASKPDEYISMTPIIIPIQGTLPG